MHRTCVFSIDPIGYVRAHRTAAEDDDWGDTAATIELVAGYGADSLTGLDAFSHVEIVYVFDRVDPTHVTLGARHPRNNPAWPRVGIFAQRAKGRPNRLGTTICRLLGIEGATLRVAELDAIDGTPVIDLKPVMREFLPRSPVVQPAWSTELMANYWRVT
jgi:tRNA (adenine37-N6)-methyltransferase